MHLHDIHAPFQNDQALEVVFQLVKHAQPKVIVLGSDCGDFPLLSSFAHDPDIDEATSDELDTFELFWLDFIRKLRRLVPKAIFVFIYGNHEIRLFRYLMENGTKVRRSVLRRFIEIVRCGGDVLYLGDKVDWVRMGPLLIMHGNRTGTNPAKAIFDDVSANVTIQFGHNHRLSKHEVNGDDGPRGASPIEDGVPAHQLKP